MLIAWKVGLITFLLGVVQVASDNATMEVLSAVFQNKKISLIKGKQKEAIAWAQFKDSTLSEGFAYLEVFINNNTENDVGAYAAGALEAALTKNLMDNYYTNMLKDYCLNNDDYCDRLDNFLKKQIEYMYERANELRDQIPYWNQVFLLLQQLTGLDDQYSGRKLNAVNKYRFTRRNPVMFLNWEADMIDLETVYNKTRNKNSLNQTGHCSALIKVTHDDIYFGHTSWYTYKAMIRILKRYSFFFDLMNTEKSAIIPGSVLSMSSYPGKLSSFDDFYLSSSGLAITETTTPIYNPALWKNVNTKTVPAWMRGLVATRLANTPSDWANLFKEENSGTYNNQWMILDYKNVEKNASGISLKKGAFYVIEQIPGLTSLDDMTNVLVEKTYWSSFNIPYFKHIYYLAGYVEKAATDGRTFSFDNHPRYRIFDRDHKNISSMDSMMAMMQYNNYMNDPESRQNITSPPNPTWTIAARYDLTLLDENHNNDEFDYGAKGAIDAKVTNIENSKKLQFVAVQGPTHDRVPVFSWSKSRYGKAPVGQPDVFNFTSVNHEWCKCS